MVISSALIKGFSDKVINYRAVMQPHSKTNYWTYSFIFVQVRTQKLTMLHDIFFTCNLGKFNLFGNPRTQYKCFPKICVAVISYPRARCVKAWSAKRARKKNGRGRGGNRSSPLPLSQLFFHSFCSPCLHAFHALLPFPDQRVDKQ